MLHLKRYFVSLAVVLTALGAYALAVAPWLEPPPIERRPIDRPLPNVQASASTRVDLNRLFDEGAWERNNPKIVETESCTLLVQDYQPTPDGKLELNPCTLIFYAQPAEGQTERRPIVLQAPQGAIVQFDRALDIARAQFGKLVSGRLQGEITIFSPPTSPGAKDDLHLTTRNVQIDKGRIFTSSGVDFRYGDSHGRGRDLTIALLPKNPEDPNSGIGGVKSITLAKIDYLHLESSGGALPGLSGAAKTQPGESQVVPVEVTCQGPLVFDVAAQTAMLDEGVEVQRVNPSGPPDKLSCQRLLLTFGDEPTSGSAGAAPSQGAAPLPAAAADPLVGRLKRIVAIGSPATLVAPSSATVATAARIEYSLTRRRLLLLPGPQAEQVSLRQEEDEFKARELEYELAEPGRLGRLWAAGPGQLKLHQARGAARQAIVARWQRELRVRPDKQNQVISLTGDASITADPLGQFNADELHLWVLEVPAESSPESSPTLRVGQTVGQPAEPASAPAEKPDSQPPPRFTILPDRLLATGRVRLESPRLHVDTARLEMWFLNQPAKPQRLPPVGQPPVGQPPIAQQIVAPAAHQQAIDISPARPGQLPLRPPTQQKFDLTGDLIQMQVVRQGNEMELESLLIQGHLALDESRTPEPGQQPIRIRGRRLELREGVSGPGKVDVVGQPAEVGGRGLTLAGAEIHLVRDENRLWIDGPGEARLPAAVDLALPGSEPASGSRESGVGNREAGSRVQNSAPPVKPAQEVHVVWQNGFTFDGQTAEMRGEVQARTATQVATGQMLDVSLNRRIDFANPSARGDTDLARLKFDGGVLVVNRSLDEHGEQASYDQLQVKNLVIDRAANSLHADGPGWMSSTRLANSGLPGVAGQTPTAVPPADPAAPPKLNYIHIDFQGPIVGDLAKREIEFQNQVRTIYSPVADWDQKVVAERLEDLGERGILLTSQRLSVVEMTPPGQPRWIETTASGNAVVEGKTFTVHAPKVAYTSDKQLMTLEGDGRAEAELWYRTVPGQNSSYSAARKWRYWTGTQTFDVEGIKVFDFNLLNTGRFRLPGVR